MKRRTSARAASAASRSRWDSSRAWAGSESSRRSMFSVLNRMLLSVCDGPSLRECARRLRSSSSAATLAASASAADEALAVASSEDGPGSEGIASTANGQLAERLHLDPALPQRIDHGLGAVVDRELLQD